MSGKKFCLRNLGLRVAAIGVFIYCLGISGCSMIVRDLREVKAKTVTLTFKADGGTWADGTTEDKTVTGDIDANLGDTPANPTRSGYAFSAWNPAVPGTFPAADTTYTATWVRDGDYTISYQLDGGTNDVANPAGYNVETETITLAPATKTGYTFAGWYSDSGFTASVTQIAKGSTGAVTLYAKWTANVYYLTIDAQGGTPGTMKFYEKYDTGWYTDEACTNEITSDTVLTVPTRSGYAFVGIYGTTDGSGDCYITAAGKKTAAVTNTIINDHSVTLYAVWKEATPPAAVTSLTATTGSAQVTLHWTNPADSDFSKAVVEYATTADTATVLGTYEAAGTAGAAGTYTVAGLTNGTSYTFTVYAQDGAGNRSGGASVKATAGCYVAEDGSMVINGTELDKTGVAAVIATGSTATVAMTDDSSWSGYYFGSYAWCKGVFLKNRTVKLSAYAMGQYEVTQELYKAVTGSSPSSFNSGAADGETQSRRPVEKVSWYDAIVFCNKLSVLMGYDPCYTIVVNGSATSDTSKWGTVPTGTSTVWDAAVCDLTKDGYRLPTEAEWEYAARGGDAAAPAWKYAYAGVAAVTGTTDITSSTTDANLAGYAWYTGNASYMTHEAGKKCANALGLYDMSGNVWEWCWDWYADNATGNDSAYTKDGVVVDPLGAASGSNRVIRGGCWSSNYGCAVSIRYNCYAYFRFNFIGFRVCRTAK